MTRTANSLIIQFAIFFLVAAGLLYFHGTRYVVTLDEGIVLETAQRMVSGQRLYVDFFGYMSPGGYWLQELVFRVFGVSLLAGRILPIVWCALQASLVFRLTDRFATRLAASIATLLFVALQLEDHTNISAKHRWDSAALALLSISFAVDAKEKQSMWRWAISGAFGCAAILCTPSMAILVVITLLWICSAKQWKAAAAYLSGMVGLGFPALLLLLSEGILQPFISQMLWLSHSHSEVNAMAYGSIMGGYSKILANGEGIAKLLPAGLAACLALPAILPVLGVSGLTWEALRGKVKQEEKSIFLYMAAVILALIVATMPRLCVSMLLYTSALPLAAAAIYISRSWPARATAYSMMVLGIFMAAFAMNFWSESTKSMPLISPVGIIRPAPDDRPGVAALLEKVKPGQSLFVHPYMPLLYFVTQAKNVSRFNFLHPGMMAASEEQTVMDDLTKSSPEWLLFLAWSREDFLSLFPGGANRSDRFPRIESWIEANYKPVEPAVNVSGYKLMQKRRVLEGM